MRRDLRRALRGRSWHTELIPSAKEQQLLSLSVGLEDKVIFVAEMLQQFLTHRIAAAQWSWSRWLLEALLGSSGVGWDQQGVNLSINLGRDITHA